MNHEILPRKNARFGGLLMAARAFGENVLFCKRLICLDKKPAIKINGSWGSAAVHDRAPLQLPLRYLDATGASRPGGGGRRTRPAPAAGAALPGR